MGNQDARQIDIDKLEQKRLGKERFERALTQMRTPDEKSFPKFQKPIGPKRELEKRQPIKISQQTMDIELPPDLAGGQSKNLLTFVNEKSFKKKTSEQREETTKIRRESNASIAEIKINIQTDFSVRLKDRIRPPELEIELSERPLISNLGAKRLDTVDYYEDMSYGTYKSRLKVRSRYDAQSNNKRKSQYSSGEQSKVPQQSGPRKSRFNESPKRRSEYDKSSGGEGGMESLSPLKRKKS